MQALIKSITGSVWNVLFTFDDASTFETKINMVPYATDAIKDGKPVVELQDPLEDMENFLREHALSYLKGKDIEKKAAQNADKTLEGRTIQL